MEAVNEEISKYEDKILNEINSIDGSYISGIEESIKEKYAFIERKENVLVRAKEAYQAGVDTLEEYKESKAKIAKETAEIEKDIEILKLQLKHADTKQSAERLSITKEFKDKINEDSLSNEKLNKLYNTIVHSITWEGGGNDIKIKVDFL